ncbi:MAG: helix-turn-helix domain-containing protein [Candidatus Omnitrophica bacterium]|nr:helix-turn-helix domain-containing protein [Candidatus Omnitrophota bacterium]
MAEVAQFLGVTEGEVKQLVKEGKLTGYKLGGRFLRFRPQQVKELGPSVEGRPPGNGPASPSVPALWGERVQDFFYFYDLYLLSGALLVGLVVYLISARG